MLALDLGDVAEFPFIDPPDAQEHCRRVPAAVRAGGDREAGGRRKAERPEGGTRKAERVELTLDGPGG